MFLWLKFKPEDLDEELSRISGQGRPETGVATGTCRTMRPLSAAPVRPLQLLPSILR